MSSIINTTPLNVQKITPAAGCSDNAVVMVKLTDEMFTALEQCMKSGKKIRIHVEEQGGKIAIGDGAASSQNNNTFRFQKQSNFNDSTDTLIESGGVVRNVGTYITKYQIQATDKSFEETKKKAERRAEAEKSRGTKETKKNVPVGSSRYLGASSSAPRNLATLGSNSSVRSPAAFSYVKASTSQQQIAGSAQNKSSMTPKADMLKPELMKKTLKKRIIHLVVTQKYNNFEDVYKKLKEDGLPEEKNDLTRIENIVKEVSELCSLNGMLSLKPTFMSEVDPRWMFYTAEEKAAVRKLMAGGGSRAAASSDAASFAPMRKKGMERLTASSRNQNPSVVEKVVTSSIPPVAPASTPVSNVEASKKLSDISESDDDINFSSRKRKAHNPSSNHAASLAASNGNTTAPPPTTTVPPSGNTPLGMLEKRPRRQESASPPEDPMINNGPSSSTQGSGSGAGSQEIKSRRSLLSQNNHHHRHHSQHNQNHHTQHHAPIHHPNGGAGSTASSRVSSPASSLSSPSQPSCDWEKEFGEIKSLAEAEEYFKMFHREYPLYIDCYRKLARVSNEFRSFESKWADVRRKNGTSGKEVFNLEREIQLRYAYYEKDPEFMRYRQKHTDLRSKLGVLKNRITSWESVQKQ